MSISEESPVFQHFSDLHDPRREASTDHPLLLILFIFISGVLCGCDSMQSVSMFASNKKSWLGKFFDLSNGIPSYDTLRRVLSLISPKAFEQCFQSWTRDIAQLSQGEVIAIDGKALRGSRSKKQEQQAFVMVNAWATKNKLVLGQLKVADKSNEITAVPTLLESLMIEGCIVTLDAMGCQKNIAAKIVERKADYILGLKGNQGKIHQDTKALFEECEEINYVGVDHDVYHSDSKGHGRQEKRTVYAIDSEDWIENHDDWPGLKSVALVVSERLIKGIKQSERRYYLTSLEADAAKIGVAIRAHWEVENQVHWSLDVSYREDDSQIRESNIAENMSRVRRLTLNLLKNDKKTKVGITIKRQKAGWNEEYLESILGLNPS